jgi:hypothetical protein
MAVATHDIALGDLVENLLLGTLDAPADLEEFDFSRPVIEFHAGGRKAAAAVHA